MQTADFAVIAADFFQIVNSNVWCSVATIDTRQRVRTRVLHPIWERHDDSVVGWVTTGRHTLKAKHLAQNPHASLCYMKDPLKPLYLDVTGTWVENAAEKQRINTLFVTTPPPLGYDPAQFGWLPDQPASGLLRLTPWRIELADLFGVPRIWHAVQQP